jgi:hypothetical protein
MLSIPSTFFFFFHQEGFPAKLLLLALDLDLSTGASPSPNTSSTVHAARRQFSVLHLTSCFSTFRAVHTTADNTTSSDCSYVLQVTLDTSACSVRVNLT